MTRLRIVLVLAATCAAAPAAGQPFPTRAGELGVLDVPDAEVVGVGGNGFAGELRIDGVKGQPVEGGPLPLSGVAGLANGLDVGLYVREWGQPGDPRPARILFGARTKLQLLPPGPTYPGIALSAGLDRINGSKIADGRLVASTGLLGPFRLMGYAGAEAELGGGSGLAATYGAAVAATLAPRFELAVEAAGGPRGGNLGAGLRWLFRPRLAASVSTNYFPGDEGFRLSVGIAYGFAVPRPRPAPAAIAKAEEPEEAPIERRGSWEDRPRFRLRIPLASPERLGEPRRLQHGPWTAVAVAAAGPEKAAAAGPARPSAPSLDDLAEAQLREQEALADARERRVRATSDQLDAREKAALDEAKRLEDRERELAGRERQLDAREQRIARGAPTQQLRQLESLEAQLASQERALSAQERGFGPALEAATGREQDAATRENAERQEANRLAASVSAAPTRAQQLEVRKQALGARNRQLAALEARLVAKGERIDALERTLRVKSERLDAFGRRLDARAERLDLLEKRAVEQQPKPAAAPKAAAAAAAAAPAAAKDKAVFVMVVKSPTAIVKEGGAGAVPAPAGAPAASGVAVERAVAAATVVTFTSAAATLSELDRETIDNIARLAAKENCEVLVWARAKDPSLMTEAQRRANEIKARVVAAGPVPEKQVVTRITTRPGAQGVDVVVSALRETAKAPAAEPAPSTARLEAGEGGKRQIREAVQAAQPLIEACVGDHLQTKKLQRAEGVLKLNVSAQGRVTKVTATGEDLAGAEVDACLGRAAGSWTFPSADADYVVDVPITIVRGGGAR